MNRKLLTEAREAFKKVRPVERVACQDFGMQQDDLLDQQIEAAIAVVLEWAGSAAYRTCAETRHVTLGDAAREEIRKLSR